MGTGGGMPTAEKLFCRRKQESERIWNDGNLDRKSAEEFAVGFDVDFAVRRTLPFGQVLADGFGGVGEIDAGHLPGAAEECAGDIGKISETAGGAAEYEAEVIAVERCAGSQFPQHSAKMANADPEKFRDVGGL